MNTKDDILERCMDLWWRTIIEWRASGGNIDNIKEDILAEQGKQIWNDCWFCDYVVGIEGMHMTCDCCPGKEFDNNFNCLLEDINYFRKPKEFWKRLRELNFTRLIRKMA